MPRYLAIDADAGGLFVAAATVGRGTVRLDQTLAFVEDPRPLSAATAKPLGAKLKDLLKQAGIAPAPVLICLGRDRVILKEIKYPPTPAADEPAVVRFQALKEMTESPEDVVLDYMPLPAPAGGERTAMVVFLKRDVLAAARVFCEAAGLKLAGVTPRPFAATAAIGRAITTGAAPPPEPADAPVAIISLTERGGEFTVARNGFVRYTRTLPPSAVASEAALIGELRRNIVVYAGQPGGSDIEAVYLAEADAGASGWGGRLRAGLQMPVYPFDPVAGAVAAERLPANIRGRFVGPVGLLAARSSSSLPINFQQPRQPRAERSASRSRLILAGIVGGLLLAGLAAAAYFFVDQEESKVAGLRKQLETVEADIARLETDEVRLKVADDYMKRQIVWVDELYDLSERSPDIDKMRVTKLLGVALPPPSEKERLREEAAQKNMSAAAIKNLPPKPVAKLSLTLATENGKLPEQLVASFAAEKQFYSYPHSLGGALLTGSGGGRSSTQLYTVEVQVVHRKPEEYKRRLTVKPPAILAPLPDIKPADASSGDAIPLDLDGGSNP